MAQEFNIYKKTFRDLVTVLQSYTNGKAIIGNKVCSFNRFSKLCYFSKSVYSPYNDGLCCNGELQMNLQACEKLANVLNKIANKDEGEDLYEVLFSSNEKRVILERESGKLILKTQKSSRTVDESVTICVDDDNDEWDECFKPNDLNDISMIDWSDEFYKVYFRKDDDLKSISQKLREFVASCRGLLKSEEEKKKTTKVKEVKEKKSKKEKTKTVPRKKRKMNENGDDIENGNDIEIDNDIEAIYMLKEFSNKLDISIYDCVVYHSEIMNEILEEKMGKKYDFVEIYKKYGNDEIERIYNDIFLSVLDYHHPLPTIVNDDEENEEED